MGTDDALLMDGLPGNLRHADGGRIGGQDRREGAEGVQLLKVVLFDCQILHNALNDNIGKRRSLLKRLGPTDPVQDGGDRPAILHSFLPEDIQIGLHGLSGPGAHLIVIHIDEFYVRPEAA